MKMYLCLPTTLNIWNVLSKMFYDGSNELKLFVLKQRVFVEKQTNRTLNEYYGSLLKD